MLQYTKQNRFTGEKYVWGELGGRSYGSTHGFMDGKKMTVAEKQEFEDMITHGKKTGLGAGGQFQYAIKTVKKNPVKPLKRRVGTSQGAKSRTTGKTPAKRLQKRRAKNTRPGYYPNPRKKFHVAVIKNGITYYYDLTNFTTDKRKAIGFDTKSEANKLKFHFDGPGWRRKFGSAKDKVTVMVIPSA